MSRTPQRKPQGGEDSPLLQKLRELGLSLPMDLERLALMRGCDYYSRELAPRIPPLGEIPISNAELAIALISPSLHPRAREIRLAAALLGAPELQAEDVAAYAVRENCDHIVHYIASCGNRFEPENEFWRALLGRLTNGTINEELLPHPTRFVEMTGIDRGKVGLMTRWIRPRRKLAA